MLLLYRTYWRRVRRLFSTILPPLAFPVAVDFPGFGRMGGEHTMKEASVPRLSG